jgi:hypothetical protein
MTGRSTARAAAAGGRPLQEIVAHDGGRSERLESGRCDNAALVVVARSEAGLDRNAPQGVVLAPARYVTLRGIIASAAWRSSARQDVITDY